jgi:hypothetical protein
MDIYRIPITNGPDVYTLVDEETYLWAATRKWHMDKDGYAQTSILNPATMRWTKRFLHRIIMGEPDGFEVDHINHNRLDNRFSNLRVVTHAQNQLNRRDRSSSTIGGGVRRYGDKFQAYFCGRDTETKKSKNKYLGIFNTLTEARSAVEDAKQSVNSKGIRGGTNEPAAELYK